jgi:hypothetical protein
MNPFILAGIIWALGAVYGLVLFFLYAPPRMNERWSSLVFSCIFAFFSLLSFIKA